MKLFSIIFFISAVLCVIFAGLAFAKKLPGKGKGTGIVFLTASGVFALCELCCIWESPKGLCLIIGGVLLVNLIFTIARNEGEKEIEE
ncbi:MAG: hypothetical protein J6A97_03790 [Clostridia bacterium]|nr:hypothetical protein [Clostridia bacterium]